MRAPVAVIAPITAFVALVVAVVVIVGFRSGAPPHPVSRPATTVAGPSSSIAVTLAPAASSGWLERRTDLTVRPDGPDRVAVFVTVRLDWQAGTGHKTVVTGSLDGLVPDHTEVGIVTGSALADLLDRLAWILNGAVQDGAELRRDETLTTVLHTVVTPAGVARDVWSFGRGGEPG